MIKKHQFQVHLKTHKNWKIAKIESIEMKSLSFPINLIFFFDIALPHSISISFAFTLVTTATNFLLTKSSTDEELESKYGTITNESTVTLFAKPKLTRFSLSTFSVSMFGSGLIACKAWEYGRISVCPSTVFIWWEVNIPFDAKALLKIIADLCQQ